MTNSEQVSLFNETEENNEPVVCLGMTFENEEARREYFREELRKKLPELKLIEGFPIGEDEEIIALSDPPYYTACPNPWINDFIEEWEKEKITKYGRNPQEEYRREPFAADVSEGKYDPVYKFHPYATKVPYKAVMRYILHYTNPGDIVLDTFGGTGMTAVAAKQCGNKKEVELLGYKVEKDGTILEKVEDIDGNVEYIAISKLGERQIIINDLSPIATNITYNFNSIDTSSFYQKIESELEKIEQNNKWMYSTIHNLDSSMEKSFEATVSELDNENDIKNLLENNQIQFGSINFVAWSDVFICNNCTEEFVYWDEAVEFETGKINNEFTCPNCQVSLKKGKFERAWITFNDPVLKEIVSQYKQVPVLINYSVGNKRFVKKPDFFDYKLTKIVENINWTQWIPTDNVPVGEKTNEPIKVGIKNIHHFYTNRNLKILSDFRNSCEISIVSKILTRVATRITKMYGLTYQSGKWGAGGGPLSGTLYIPSLVKELNMINQLKKSFKTQLNKTWSRNIQSKPIISTGSSTVLNFIKDESIDYIFLDPPFGANLMYSELNFIWESWLKVRTNIENEAIVNSKQQKNLGDYKTLMLKCFKEVYRVLRSNGWLTVEFSNTKASVWNSIQSTIEEAGFVIANVSALDKQKGSFKVITSTTAVKQDLVISAYKPSDENIDKMKEESNTPASAWTFVAQHLEKLPVFLGSKGEASIIAERTPRILFDRMVAYHVQNGLPVPISSAEFQEGVVQRFSPRDGMIFLESQVAEYDKKRTLVKEFTQMSLFVSDENSAIEWIRQQLLKKPQTRQDLHPQFMKEIQHIAKHEQLPELDALLVQNFLRFDGDEAVPNQIATYLRANYHDLRGLENDDSKLQEKAMNRWYVPDPNKQADLEKLREKALLREFEGYVEELGSHKKKLKVFRTEAIRAGFKKAWSEKDYAKIVNVGDRLPESVIQEDDKLLMYYDNAQIRLDM